MNSCLRVEDGYDLWLRYDPLPESDAANYRLYVHNVYLIGNSKIAESVGAEFTRALPSLVSTQISVFRLPDIPTSEWNTSILRGNLLLAGRFDYLANYGIALPAISDAIRNTEELPPDDGYRIFSIQMPDHDGSSRSVICITAETDLGVLYGTFAFLRLLQTGKAIDALNIYEYPKIRFRMMNHWDNLDGSIERGYAGRTLWKWDELPVVLDRRYTDYARACASIGINSSVLNNVNTQPQILERGYLERVAAIAGVFRGYGIRVFLSVNFGSPKSIGGLPTADPCDPAVVAWWHTKADEIYTLIPDFGGFLVKADSEGQPGPFAYGRTHADGANMLADALGPHGGIVVWRAFVYGHGETDRAKKAYANFKPLDGEFCPNVGIQVKNGPIDFQPREPVHPLFGGMERTSVFMEFQIAQEYLGQGNHLVYLAPMWKEILDFDTFAHGAGSTVGRVISTEKAPAGLSGIAAVTNTGNDRNWCGHFFHPANWFAYGRLAWDYTLDTDEIAKDWIACTWTRDPAIAGTILNLMRDSWETCVDYMTPLGLHHIMKEGHHYGPDPGYNEGPREDWRPTYYHRADRTGLGFDRTRTGSDAVDQYSKPVADLFNDVKICPEKYLLWFHHVPWNYRLHSGRSLKDELVFRYARGVASVEHMRDTWKSLEGKVDDGRFNAVLAKLDIQVKDAHEWESVCTAYFLSFTEYRNLLAECGIPSADIDARISQVWNTIFAGAGDERFYFESDDGAYMLDTGNVDVRTEGMSYGMMMAVQMDHHDIFDRLWRWSKKNMFMTEGVNAGYFAWSCKPNGIKNAHGPAPDGEEYYALALFFASHRWGDGGGIFNYGEEARTLLHTCIHKGEDGNGYPMWDPVNFQIKFVPDLSFTDPSYHLPHFYDLFAQWARPEDRDFWKNAAEASRRFLPTACHPETGLAPEYSWYNGTPNSDSGHGDFYSDSYRVASNIGLDTLWTGGSVPLCDIARRILTFFDGKDPAEYRAYQIDGTPLEIPALHPVGLIAANAEAALALFPSVKCGVDDGGSSITARESAVARTDASLAERAVRRFFDTPLRTGNRRYYDNCLYFFALLALSGRYRIW